MEDFILETKNLTKSFKGFTAVNDVCLRIRRGYIHALIGPNGAGKTTVFNMLTKFLVPTNGTIHFNGADITCKKPSEIADLGVVRSFQISAVFPHLTAKENVRTALQRKLGTAYHFWKSDRSLNVLNDRAIELLDSVGLASFSETVTVELAYGRKRLLEIATTLAMEPEMLLLDEPTAGLGADDANLITALIERVSDNRTILIVEHNLKMVATLANRITVLQRGSILAEGTYREVSDNPEVMEAYMGNADV